MMQSQKIIKYLNGYKIRLYPTKEQEVMLWKHIDACRYIWNYMLDRRESAYKSGIQLFCIDTIKLLTPMKKEPEHVWLTEVSNTSLQKECRILDFAFQCYFKKQHRYPRFKTKKKSKKSYPVCDDPRCFYFDDRFVQIQKVGKVRYKSDYSIPKGKGNKFVNVSVSYSEGKWFLSFSLECENQAPALTNLYMGIDLGTRKLATVVFGDNVFIYDNINDTSIMKKLDKKERLLSKQLSHKYSASKKISGKYIESNNAKKIKKKLHKVHRKKQNIRHNYIHHITNELVSMLPCCVVMEDLDIMGMLKNKYRAKSIHEACWYEFIRQMQYKCERNGIEFIQVDRYFPSSKTCSHCGNINPTFGSDEIYICPECGFTIDRDINAARNLITHISGNCDV